MTTFQTICKQIQTLNNEAQIEQMERYIDAHVKLTDEDKSDLLFLLRLQQNALPPIDAACISMPDWSWGRTVTNVFNTN